MKAGRAGENWGGLGTEIFQYLFNLSGRNIFQIIQIYVPPFAKFLNFNNLVQSFHKALNLSPIFLKS